MTHPGCALIAALGLVACAPLAALAQPSQRPEPGRVEVGFGWTWTGRAAIGTGDAPEATSSGGALSLFRTSTEVAAARGVEGRVGFRLTSALALEASGGYAVASLRTEISGDYESSPPVTATESVRQFTVGGSLLWHLRHSRGRPAGVEPFLSAGGGYLRELHEGSVLVDTGRFYQVGGGVKVLVVSQQRAWLKGIGLRLDARARARTGGVVFDDRFRVSPSVSAAVYARF